MMHATLLKTDTEEGPCMPVVALAVFIGMDYPWRISLDSKLSSGMLYTQLPTNGLLQQPYAYSTEDL